MAHAGNPPAPVRRRAFRASAILGICLALLISACTPSGAGPAQATPASTTDTSRLVVAVSELGKQSFSPWLANVGEHTILQEVGETLIRVNPKTGLVEGALAESWSVTPDGTWTFKLRPNIPFHDGYGTVTAEDVKFSWEQFIQKDTIQSSAVHLKQAIDGDMKNFEIVGPLEFRVKTKKPVVYLPDALNNRTPGMAVQSKKYWETKPQEAVAHPIGTGAFKFVSSTQGVEVQLQAVSNHWRQTPTFKAVTFRIIPEEAARMAAVASGAVDLAQVPPKLLREAKANGLNSISLKDTSSWGIFFGGWYVGDNAAYDRKAPWIQADDPAKGLAIRQAMSLALDRKTIIDKVFAGEGQPSHAPFFEYPSNPLTSDPSWPLPSYDVAKAKQLLAQGGYPNGFEVTVPVYDRANMPGILDINEAVASYLEAIGLKVKRMTGDYNGVILPLIRAKKTAGWVYPSAISTGDPLLVLSQNFVVGSSLPRFSDPSVDDAIAKMSKEFDINKRYAIFRDFEANMIKNVIGGIPLFTSNNPYLTSKKVGAWFPVPGLVNVSNLETVTPK